MPASAKRFDAQPLTQLTPEAAFAGQREREVRLARLVVLYVGTGLLFMLLPGTFLGVWNLISISSRQEALAVSPSWIQAHGHAQVFGWIGTFILGVGFHSIPKMRRLEPFSLGLFTATWGLWTAGIALRWLANVYLWHWRFLLPVSAALELVAFSVFFHVVSRHRPAARTGSGLEAGAPGSVPEVRLREPAAPASLELRVLVVMTGMLGFAGVLLANLDMRTVADVLQQQRRAA